MLHLLTAQGSTENTAIMDYQEKIRACLQGGDQEKRAHMLSEFLAAFERGGSDEAAAVLSRKMTDLEIDFDRRLSALHDLF